MKVQLFHRGEPIDVEVDASLITLGAGSGALRIDGRPARFLYERSGGKVRIAVGGECFEFDLSGEARAKRGGGAHGNPETRSPMPGKVLQVTATPGAEVSPGDPLLILEAMKMENVLSAEVAGTVKEVHVKAGDMVDPGKLLVVIEAKS